MPAGNRGLARKILALAIANAITKPVASVIANRLAKSSQNRRTITINTSTHLSAYVAFSFCFSDFQDFFFYLTYLNANSF